MRAVDVVQAAQKAANMAEDDRPQTFFIKVGAPSEKVASNLLLLPCFITHARLFLTCATPLQV
jgi:hypothetical protein